MRRRSYLWWLGGVVAAFLVLFVIGFVQGLVEGYQGANTTAPATTLLCEDAMARRRNNETAWTNYTGYRTSDRSEHYRQVKADAENDIRRYCPGAGR